MLPPKARNRLNEKVPFSLPLNFVAAPAQIRIVSSPIPSAFARSNTSVKKGARFIFPK